MSEERMRCVRCACKVPEERVRFLVSSGRDVFCINCQNELEEEGIFRAYVAELIVDDGCYTFGVGAGEPYCDPTRIYRNARKFITDGMCDEQG